MTDAEYAVVACWANWLLDGLRYPDIKGVGFARWNCCNRRRCPQGELCEKFQTRHGGRAVTVAQRAIATDRLTVP